MKKSIPGYFLFLVFFFLLSSYANAQYFKPVWVNDIGGTGDSKASNIAADNNGNIYISGYIRGTVTFNLKEGGSKTLTSNGDADIYVAKYSIATGNYIWAFSIGGPALEQPNSMAVDNAGNVLVTGQYTSTVNFDPAGNFQLTPNGADDIFVAKYTSNGNFLWAISMGGAGIDRGHYVVTDNQNNVFITGSYTGATDMDPSAAISTLPDQGSLSGFFAKYDANGNFVWAHPLGVLPTQADLVNLTIDRTTNDVVVDGDFSGNVDFSYAGNAAATFNSAGVSNFVARYDNNGAYKWVRYLPGSGSGILSCVKIDNQSNIIITGNFGGQFYANGPSGTALTANGTNDLLVASYQSDGTLKWAENFGSNTGDVNSRYVCVDASNNIYITGYFTGTVNISGSLSDGILSNTTGGRSVLIAGFNSSGTPIAAGAIGAGCPSNLGYEIAAANGNIFVSGAFCSTEDFDTGSCNTDNFTAINGTSDSFLASFTIASSGPIINNVITAPAIASFCGNGDPGAITASTPSGGSGTYTYQWQSSPDNVTFTDITGATLITYDPPLISATTYYRRIVSSACTQPVNSNAIGITVQPALAGSAITAPAVTTFCASGDPAVITAGVATGGDGTYVYQWQSSTDCTTFTDIPGATSVNYDPLVLNGTTYYRRTVTSGACLAPLISNVITISVLSVVANNAITAPAVASFCSNGDPGVIIGSTPTGGNNTYVFQWQSSTDNITFNDIAGETAKDYDPAVLNTTTYYRRTVTSGACITPLISNVITISVFPIVANNSITAPAVASFCSNGDPGVIIGSTPIGGNNTYVFQWQSSTDNLTYNDIAGATAKDYDPAVLNATTYYRRTVISGTCITPLISSPVQIEIIPQLSAPAVSVGATTTSSITFQWDAVSGATGYQVSLDNGQTFTDPSSGSNGLTHTVTGLQAQQSVTIMVRAAGSSSCALSSNSTAVTGIAASPLGDQIFVPNAFTPNGDGRNDIVYVHSANIKSLKFYIYDQWGELLYTSLNQASGWDGTYKGTKEPVGVYVYYLEAVMNDGQWVNRKGTITLLR
jgi:gliding motility-associated-like protein